MLYWYNGRKLINAFLKDSRFVVVEGLVSSWRVCFELCIIEITGEWLDMAPNPRVLKAFRAMKDIGISEDKTKPVLKKLLKLFDKNWELIEEENYRVLADAIFDEEDNKVTKEKKCQNSHAEDFREDIQAPDEPERPLKRLRLRGQETQVSPAPNTNVSGLDGAPLKKPKLEEDECPETRLQQPMQLCAPKRFETGPGSSRRGDKGKEPVSPHIDAKVKKANIERTSTVVRFKEPVGESRAVNPKARASGAHELLKPKDEPFTDDIFTNALPQYELPIAAIYPDTSSKEDYSNGIDSRKLDGLDAQASYRLDECNKDDGTGTLSYERSTSSELATVLEESHANLEVASSPLGEVKISLCVNSTFGRPDFHMPSRDAVIKYMEEKCLQSYKIIDPAFSVMKLLSDMCECFLELGTDSPDERQEGGSINRIPLLDVMRRPESMDPPSVVANKGNSNLLTSMNEPAIIISDRLHVPLISGVSQSLSLSSDQTISEPSKSGLDISNGHPENDNRKEFDLLEATDPHNMMVVSERQQAPDELSFSHDMKDITKGEERVQISWVNEISEEHPPFFHYIPRSLIFRSAIVNSSLSQIGSDNCCQSCFGNCLTLSLPCACARETGAKYVYTSGGLVKDHFLEEWISLARERNHHFYCKECPLERLNNEDSLDPCKGHPERKLIKECWSKCGCSKHCGNRVVQRGITCKLQVFFTSEGKGWGLRSLEDLPKGSFVCEYAGEILTISEMYQRKVPCTKTGEHTNPILLDAYWNLEEPLEDEKALCLDATYFGNVARFINHRCFDANLVAVAVEIETPDHQYYHLALFTARQIDAMEELTWLPESLFMEERQQSYGVCSYACLLLLKQSIIPDQMYLWDYDINFDDLDHPVKPFQCRCGSKFCRDMKQSSRSKSASST